MENPIKMDDLGVPLFLETPYHLGYHYHRILFKAALQVVVENQFGR